MWEGGAGMADRLLVLCAGHRRNEQEDNEHMAGGDIEQHVSAIDVGALCELFFHCSIA